MVETNVFHPVVTALNLQKNVPDSVTETQYALERFLSISSGLANPSFRLSRDRNPLVENGGAIARGYIRRSSIDAGDPTSQYRLYFMYNPETISRGYIAYLDQQALDPGNAMFGSNNMAAAPGILDFAFELLFDRQLEVAADFNHPGTKVDYDYFDLVVRGVIPDSSADGNSIPDNGVMMVNPHNIVVIFGEDLSVQGRVTNAAVSFEKFNNAMVPMRLRIQMAMKALYIGPVQTVPNYSLYTSQAVSAATIPYENSSVNVTTEKASFIKAKVSTPVSKFPANNTSSGPGLGPDNGKILTIPETLAYARTAGFQGEALVHIVSIAIRESGLHTDARGDVTIQTGEWGPSIGLVQIRSLKAQYGTGNERDELANYDPLNNMKHAWSISGGGANFGPWSTNLGWEQYRGPVDAAIAGGA